MNAPVLQKRERYAVDPERMCNVFIVAISFFTEKYIVMSHSEHYLYNTIKALEMQGVFDIFHEIYKTEVFWGELL